MIVYEDAASVVNKPAGLSSETGLPDALRALWGKPDAYWGGAPAGHRRFRADGAGQDAEAAAAPDPADRPKSGRLRRAGRPGEATKHTPPHRSS